MKKIAGVFFMSLVFCLLFSCDEVLKEAIKNELTQNTQETETLSNSEELPATVSAVTVSPQSASVNKGGGITFTAEVEGTNNPAQTVTWEVEGGILGTDIDDDGRLTVSGSEATDAVLTVTATSTVDPQKSGEAIVTVTELKATVNSVTVSPQSANVLRNGTQQFSAAVSGTNNPSPSVTWSVTGAGAGTTINSDGLLSVAVNEAAPHTLTVKAVSAVDPTKSGEAKVAIPAPTVSAVAVSPLTASVLRGGTQPFSAVVSGTNFPAQSVTWSVTGGGNGTSINNDGLLTVSSSENLTTLTIKAVSTADQSKSGEAKVTVAETTIPVTLTNFTADGSTSATTTKLTLTFSAAITGLTADDIALSGVTVTKGTLSASGSTYTLGISDFTSGGTLTVSVAKSGYTVSGTPKTVTIYRMTPVTLSVTADGSSSQTTKQLTLTFSQAIDGLSASDITLSMSGVTVTKDTLTANGSTYTLPISGFTSGGTLNVSVAAKPGYTITGTPKTVTIYYATAVIFNEVTANGSDKQTTTQLTLKFDKAISGLTVNDIKLSDTAITKGTLSASGSTYTLNISNVKSTGNLNVTVEKSGFNISGSSQTVKIFYAIPVTFNGVTANGSDKQTTTQLTLKFSAAITNLSAADITLSGVSGVTKGTLSGSGTTYTLDISGVTQDGTLTVAVSKSGYEISGSLQTVAIKYAIPAKLNTVTANGNASTTTTTLLTLTFDKEINGLTASDITLSGLSGVTKGTLSGSGPTYNLGITVTQGGTLTVAVSKTGYEISGSSQTVTIYYIIPVSFSGVTANGSASATTTQLTLTFDKAITGLAAADITLSGVTGVAKGTLSGSGPTYTLPISGFTQGGSLSVTIAAAAKPGYIISGSPKTATIYYVGGVTVTTWKEITAPSATAAKQYSSFQGKNDVLHVAPASTSSGYAWNVLSYSLADHANKQIKIDVSMQVWLDVSTKVVWQVNNDDYPVIAGSTSALSAGQWHTVSGSATITPGSGKALYLSKDQLVGNPASIGNPAGNVELYITGFTITITTVSVPVDPPPTTGPVTPPPIGVGGVLDPATTNTQLSNSGFTQVVQPHKGGNKWLVESSRLGYETWDDDGGDNTGIAKFIWYGQNKGGGAAFRAEWGKSPETNSADRPKDFLARVGYFWNEGKAHTAYGNIYCGFNFDKSGQYRGDFSYIGIYGWSKNPTVEYYIVENSYGNAWYDHAEYISRLNNDTLKGTEMESYTLDGSVYKVYKVSRTGPSINSSNEAFTQFFSIRQTARTNGTISVSEHFKKWAERGMNLGSNMYECKFKVEVGGRATNGSASTAGYFDARLIQFYRANNDGTIIQITQ
jgi:hypothetical protein